MIYSEFFIKEKFNPEYLASNMYQAKIKEKTESIYSFFFVNIQGQQVFAISINKEKD